MTQKILIIGATSALAQATARQWAQEKTTEFFLIARNTEKLNEVANDLKSRGATVHLLTADLETTTEAESLITTAWQTLSTCDIALIAHGSLSNQTVCEASVKEMLREFNINAVSAIALLTVLANRFAEQKRGCLAVITSIAGDRGRRNSYVYCTAKATVSTFVEGLTYRLAPLGVTVLDIRPGPIATPMTAHLTKSALWSTPEKVATDILKAIAKKRHRLYTPFFWQYIMFGIRHIPLSIYQKLSNKSDAL